MNMRFYKLTLLGLFCLMVVTPLEEQVWCAPGGKVAGVTVSPDGRHVAIRWDGPVGNPNAFVLRSPNRLVIDFEGTTLGAVPRNVPVENNSIKEIRLGYSGSRARVVMDLGENNVPPYRFHKENNRLLVMLGGPPLASVAVANKRKTVTPVARVSMASVTTNAPPAQAKGDSAVVIKAAGVRGDMLIMELADMKNPRRTCRLVLDVDLDRLKVRKATLTDKRGYPHNSDSSPGFRPQRHLEIAPMTSRGGPRREPLLPEVDTPRKPVFKWGGPTVRQMGPRTAWSAHVGE